MSYAGDYLATLISAVKAALLLVDYVLYINVSDMCVYLCTFESAERNRHDRYFQQNHGYTNQS